MYVPAHTKNALTPRSFPKSSPPIRQAQGRLRRGPCTSFQRMFDYANMTKAFFVIPDLVGDLPSLVKTARKQIFQAYFVPKKRLIL